jgi:hypothetical protein
MARPLFFWKGNDKRHLMLRVRKKELGLNHSISYLNKYTSPHMMQANWILVVNSLTKTPTTYILDIFTCDSFDTFCDFNS